MPRILKKEQTIASAGLAFFFLYLYTVSVLIRPHEYSLETADLVFIKMFVVSAFVLTLFTLRPLKLSPQMIMLLLLIPHIIISKFLNGSGMQGIDQAERLLISSAIPFFLYSSLVTSMTRQKLIMVVMVVAALLMVANGYLQQISFNGVYGEGVGGSMSVGRDEIRITYLGFFGDPNDLGMFLVMCIPVICYFMNQGNFLTKSLMFLSLIAFGYGIYMTGSRGTILGALGVIATYFLVSNAGVKLILFGVLSAPVAATILASFGGLSSSDSSAMGRLDAWYDGVLMLLHNPVFGVGMGNFMDEHGKVAHNSYIHVAGELGIPGYALWGGLLLLNMRAGYSLIDATKSHVFPDLDAHKLQVFKQELLLNKTLFYSMVGFMITAFFLSRQYTLVMYIFLGLQTASFQRIINLDPSFKDSFNLRSCFIAMAWSWSVIAAVYLALKVGL